MMTGSNSSAPPPPSLTAAFIECLQQSTIHPNISNAFVRVVMIANEWTASDIAVSVESSCMDE